MYFFFEIRESIKKQKKYIFDTIKVQFTPNLFLARHVFFGDNIPVAG